MKDRVTHLARTEAEIAAGQGPTTHLGSTASELERQGWDTDRGDRNRDVVRRNQARKSLWALIEEREGQIRLGELGIEGRAVPDGTPIPVPVVVVAMAKAEAEPEPLIAVVTSGQTASRPEPLTPTPLAAAPPQPEPATAPPALSTGRSRASSETRPKSRTPMPLQDFTGLSPNEQTAALRLEGVALSEQRRRRLLWLADKAVVREQRRIQAVKELGKQRPRLPPKILADAVKDFRDLQLQPWLAQLKRLERLALQATALYERLRVALTQLQAWTAAQLRKRYPEVMARLEGQSAAGKLVTPTTPPAVKDIEGGPSEAAATEPTPAPDQAPLQRQSRERRQHRRKSSPRHLHRRLPRLDDSKPRWSCPVSPGRNFGHSIPSIPRSCCPVCATPWIACSCSRKRMMWALPNNGSPTRSTKSPSSTPNSRQKLIHRFSIAMSRRSVRRARQKSL